MAASCDAKTKARSFEVTPVELGKDAMKEGRGTVDVAFTTAPSAIVGFDVIVDPPSAPIAWSFFLDDAPWPDNGVFAGPYGLASEIVRRGLTSDDGRLAVAAHDPPPIDPRRDLGLFVVRERGAEKGEARTAEEVTQAEEEMARLLREWGYANGTGGRKK